MQENRTEILLRAAKEMLSHYKGYVTDTTYQGVKITSEGLQEDIAGTLEKDNLDDSEGLDMLKMVNHFLKKNDVIVWGEVVFYDEVDCDVICLIDDISGQIETLNAELENKPSL